MIVAYVYNNNPKSKFFGQIGWCHLNAEGELQIAPVYVRYKSVSYTHLTLPTIA